MKSIMIIMKKHLLDNLNIKRTLIYFFIILITSYLFAFKLLTRGLSSMPSLVDQQHTLISNYFLIGFIWTCGIPLLLYLIYLSSASISKEISESTFLLIISRPVKRSSILIGKFLSVLIYSLILNFTILLTLPSMASLILNLDNSLTMALYGVSLSLLIHTLLISIFIISLSLIFSIKFEKVTTTNIILFILIILIFLAPFMIRQSFYREDFYDPSYIIGSSSVSTLNMFGLDINPQTKETLSYFSGIFSLKRIQSDLYPYNLIEPGKTFPNLFYISPFLLILFSLILTSLSHIMFKKKEIY